MPHALVVLAHSVVGEFLVAQVIRSGGVEEISRGTYTRSLTENILYFVAPPDDLCTELFSFGVEETEHDACVWRVQVARPYTRSKIKKRCVVLCFLFVGTGRCVDFGLAGPDASCASNRGDSTTLKAHKFAAP